MESSVALHYPGVLGAQQPWMPLAMLPTALGARILSQDCVLAWKQREAVALSTPFLWNVLGLPSLWSPPGGPIL